MPASCRPSSGPSPTWARPTPTGWAAGVRRRAARSGKGGRERKAESRERQLFFVEGERTAFSVRKSARCFSLHNGQGQRNGAAAAAARDVRNGARSGNTDKGIEKGGGEGEKGEKILSHLVRLPKKKHGPVRGGERGPTRPTRAGSAWRGKVSVPPWTRAWGCRRKKACTQAKHTRGAGQRGERVAGA